jgi:hypothetical protein
MAYRFGVRQVGVDTMDLDDRGHSVPGVLVGVGGFDWKRSKPREVGTIRRSGRYRGATPNAQQLPNKSLRSNARNAVTGKSLAKCEKPLCLRHFGEHWLILCPGSLTKNGGMFPVV